MFNISCIKNKNYLHLTCFDIFEDTDRIIKIDLKAKR